MVIECRPGIRYLNLTYSQRPEKLVGNTDILKIIPQRNRRFWCSLVISDVKMAFNPKEVTLFLFVCVV